MWVRHCFYPQRTLQFVFWKNVMFRPKSQMITWDDTLLPILFDQSRSHYSNLQKVHYRRNQNKQKNGWRLQTDVSARGTDVTKSKRGEMYKRNRHEGQQLTAHWTSKNNNHKSAHRPIRVNGVCIEHFIGKKAWRSPDLAPSDYYLFPNLKRCLCGKRFESNEEVEWETKRYFGKFGKSYYLEGIKKLKDLWTCCIELKEEYIEK